MRRMFAVVRQESREHIPESDWAAAGVAAGLFPPSIFLRKSAIFADCANCLRNKVREEVGEGKGVVDKSKSPPMGRSVRNQELTKDGPESWGPALRQLHPCSTALAGSGGFVSIKVRTQLMRLS